MDFPYIWSKVRKMRRIYGSEKRILVVIDYLQLIEGNPSSKQNHQAENQPKIKNDGQRTQCGRHRSFTAEPRRRKSTGQASDAFRPLRMRSNRTGCRSDCVLVSG